MNDRFQNRTRRKRLLRLSRVGPIMGFYIALLLWNAPTTEAQQTKIRKTELVEALGKRKPASDSPEFMGGAVFANYVKCAAGSESRRKADIEKCARRYFHDSVDQVVLSAYVDALVFPNEYSEAFYCDAATLDRMTRFADAPFDFILCFESNVLAPGKKTGAVYFKRSGAVPLITRLKI